MKPAISLEDRIPDRYFLFGYLQTLSNQIQRVGDKIFQEISMKQWYVLIAVRLYPYPPTLQEVTKIVGSSRQNVKQILLKLQKLAYVTIMLDETDKRKQRIVSTDKAEQFFTMYDSISEICLTEVFNGIAEEEMKMTRNVLLKIGTNLEQLSNHLPDINLELKGTEE